MAQKNHYLTIDTETTQDGLVADFAATITDKNGNILNQCAVLTNGIYTDMENHPLFFTSDKDGIWSKDGQDRRYSTYQKMVESGSRMVASTAAINRWLDRAAAQYNPVLTAYNLAFDLGKCQNTGIDLTMFGRQFCLWQAAYAAFGQTKAYRNFALRNHAFNAPTKFGNMTYKTNAEVMARFVLGQPELQDEPHTALEDIVYYELPILNAVLRKWSLKKIMEKSEPVCWRKNQVKDYFIAK